MIHRLLLSTLAVALPTSLLAAGKIPEGLSYTRPLAADVVFVMHGDLAAEAKSSASSQAEFRDLRTKYPQSGLYRGTVLIWAIDGPFAPSDAVFLTADGRHMVRLDGQWWKEKDFPGQRRLAAGVERTQLDAPAVSFFDSGRLVKQYLLKEIASHPEKLPHSPNQVLWVAGAVVNDDTGRFLLFVQDSTRLTFDVTTGELVTREEAGLGNPVIVPILAAAGTMVVIILAVWAYFVLVRWRAPSTVPPT